MRWSRYGDWPVFSLESLDVERSNSHGNCENNTGKRRMRSVWNMATTASGGVTHYAKFPNELAERCILCGTAEGDVVLDPFVGSGTSCRVANRYGRQYIGD